MADLMIHCGGYGVGRTDLAQAPTPEPTASWHPIPHHRLVEQVEEGLAGMGLRIQDQAHALARDGQRYFGLIRVANGQNSDDYAWVMGLRNSHDMSFPAGLVVGSRVFVCDNLAFSGEIRIARRHTRNINRDLPGLINRSVARLVERWHRQDERIEAYRNKPVTDFRAHDLVIRALDGGVITATRVPAVLSEWREPSHPEFNERSGWSLFNAFTEVLKDSSVWNLPARTESLHGLMDGFCGLTDRDRN